MAHGVFFLLILSLFRILYDYANNNILTYIILSNVLYTFSYLLQNFNLYAF